jgi:outer membrane protein OmpU
MKKILYGTTALVAAGMISSAAYAADPIKLTVGGHMWQFFGFSEMDETVTDNGNVRSNAFGVGSDVEVYFSGETKLDNGLIVGARIELEAERTSGTNTRNADQQYAYIKGGFGEISAGDRIIVQNIIHNNAPGFGIDWTNTRNMFIPETFSGGAGNNPATTGAGAATASLAGAYGEHRTDFDGLVSRGTAKLQYVSPVMLGGFTGAVVYVPNAAAISASNTTGAGRGVANETANAHDLLGAAVAYKGKPLWGIDVGADVGYARMQRPSGAATASNNGYVQAWSAGLVFGYAGVKVGGSFMRVDDKVNYVGEIATTSTSLDGYAWDAGVSYEWGNWGVSYTYFRTEVEGVMGARQVAGVDMRGDDSTQFHKGAIMYKMGPGIVTDISAVYGEYENEGGGKTNTNLTNSMNGYALIGGLRLAF